MLPLTQQTTYCFTIAHYATIACTAAILAGCAGTTTATVKVPVDEFIELSASEAQSSQSWRVVRTVDGTTERLTGTIEEYRIVHKSGVLRLAPPVYAYSEGLHLGLVTASGRKFDLTDVSHVAVDYRPAAGSPTSESKSVGIALLAVGTPILAVSTLFFVGGLMSGGEGAIPVVFVSPLVALGATALVIPGIVLVRRDQPKPQGPSAWIRPTLQVLPNGVVMTTAF